MDVFEKILYEIDKGIKTIEPLMNGETRQITESKIIGLEEARKIVEKYKDETGWIPCSERLPDKVIVLCDVLYAEETDEAFHDIKILNYIGGGKFVNSWNDEQKVIAWMPPPEPYKPEAHGTKKQTNADRIRNMSDEELSDFIEMKQFFALARNGTDGEDFTLKWLQSEVEE